MKLWETFRYEVAYQLRSISTWFFFLLLLVVSFFMARDIFIEEMLIGGYTRNSPYFISKITVIGFILGVWILAPLAGNAAARDLATRMHPLLYAAPVSKLVYLGGRYLAAFALGAFVMTAIPLGLLVASFLPSEHVGLPGPFNPAAYISAYVLLLLPTTFVAVALMFAVAVLSRRGISSFLVGIFMVFTALATWQLLAVELKNWNLAKLMDPLGITLIQELKSLWTPLEKNTRMPATQTWTLLNRLLWCAVALGFLTLTYFRFTVQPAFKADKKNRPWHRLFSFFTIAENQQRAQNAPVVVPQAKRTFGYATRILQVLTITQESFKVIMDRGWIIFVCFSIFVVVTSPSWFNEYHFVPELPVTGHLSILLENIQYNAMWFLVPLLILYYAGELVWRERETRLNEIVGAAPMPVWILFAGKFAGLSIALVVLQLLMIFSGMVVQMRLGYYNFEVGLYLKILFGIRFVEYVLLALLSFAIHIIVNQKYIAHLITLVFLIVLYFGPAIGIEPGLLVYGSDPGWTYSEIRGLEPYLGPLLLFKLYWAAWALLLAVVATLLWPRGAESGLRQRILEGSRRLTRPTKAIAAFAGLLVLILGGVIFYNTSILYPLTAAPKGEAWKAAYEKLYRKYMNSPQPWLTATNLHVEIYPESRAVEMRGSSHFVNRTTSMIDTIHLATAPGIESHALHFNPAARAVLVDSKLGHHIYVLQQPLAPGESLQLDFQVRVSPKGFPNYGIDASLVENGSYFDNAWIPSIGYRREREIDDPIERAVQGLEAHQGFWLNDDEARKGIPGQERIHFEAVVGTEKGQIAVTQGKLQGSWVENGRSYFHYAAETPITNRYAFFSAEYEVLKGQWKHPDSSQTVNIEILYHPGHSQNTERMMRGVQASLSYLSQHLGPYPHSEIRFIENSGYNKGMYAHPTNVWYRTGIALLNPEEDPREIDLIFSIVAHEVAHQWWAHQLFPAFVKGKGLLTESLAWFYALEIIEEVEGKEKFLGFLRMIQQEYFSPQSRAVQPLLLASDHDLIYQKAPLALYALREYVGKEQIGMALRKLFRENASGAPPLPTPQDLYSELQHVTPDSMQYLLHDLFAANTFWDLKTEKSTARKNRAGNWEVSLDLQARKYTVDTLGVEANVPMGDWIQIGVYKPADGQKEEREMLYLKWHRIRSGKQTIVVELPHKPAYAGIDPNHLLMDQKRMDNSKEVSLQKQE
ncbi:ABC transporter permease [Pontibacter sp. FD36]|uniref:ABC transporter permease/M1 family aminopeptidase n=1 Tax=Pontibacter sp. FD36 TaxID=2789860 RepID=UPI0018AA8499|nr:ABC transporter permease [Pontibacter sp. FD36]MBF8962140.1 ABC transporter permease [Pontibacter sp. FD36]